jgi:hypothetical protein
MARKPSPRIAVSFRLRPEAAKRIRSFLRDHAGKPLYLQPSAFAEAALLREVERLSLVLAGALPADRALGGTDDDEAGKSASNCPINAR